MTPQLFAIISIALVLLLALGAIWAWRRRQVGQGDVAAFPAPPEDLIVRIDAPMDYIATTRRDRPYDRVLVHGLAFRGPGRIAVGDDGVVLGLNDADLWIARDTIEFVERATWTIDRVVETGGMIRIGALAGEAPVDIMIRVREHDAEVTEALRALATTSSHFDPEHVAPSSTDARGRRTAQGTPQSARSERSTSA